MKVLMATSLVVTSIVLASAHPHQSRAAQYEPMAERPLHTTALMASEAWRMSQSRTQTHVPTSPPTRWTNSYEQYEL
ncbi:hypothetical protein K469DRAFT_715396 [Zopfia rhizophila CBS 207.26]|uniref:Secreted protein n=1 Tax=Zopfia rhizophila CBS 207.26 TaxID=1314779 RepID=A0A6A6DPM0_9PEZI|nr:hypothetical protein K469DRAFT_715396 [Zopfia rhizophila CBS 207.26]